MTTKEQQTVEDGVSQKMASLFNADSIEQYGRRDSILFYGIPQTNSEDTYQKLTDAVGQAGITIKKEDISVEQGCQSQWYSSNNSKICQT